jgi:hypothetical protein
MMEYFTPQGKRKPYPACMREVEGCDVVVAIVAHRYGWVPANEPDGGDKSITWLECERAKEVIACVIDPLASYSEWYVLRFGEIRPEWYVFPFGRPRPNDPTRPVTTLKTAWRNLRKKANVTGRWHDNRHTLITDLAESGASDQTIMDIAGHVSKQMLKHYSHIRMEAKRKALESIVPQGETATPAESKQDSSPAPTVVQLVQQVEAEYPQKSSQSDHSGRICSGKKNAKSLKRFGSIRP